MRPTALLRRPTFFAAVALISALCAGRPVTAANDSSGYWSTSFGPTGPCELGAVNSAVTLGRDLFVAGSFFDSARDSLRYVARWDGAAWRPIGNNLPGIECLAVWGGHLYAGGKFSNRTVKGSVVGLMRWDGAAWQPTSPPLAGEVFALTAYHGRLVAGGHFTVAGDEGIRHLASWDGRAWRPFAESVAGGGRTRVLALSASGDSLAVGGIFTRAGGIAARNVAMWDGKRWSACGTGTDDAVQALCTTQGCLYAGGRFRTAGGDSASGIAAWDGLKWSALGAGLRGNSWLVPSVAAIAAWRGGVVVGGSFIGADKFVAGGIATWDGSAWQAMPPGCATDDLSRRWQVHVLTTWDGKLAVGGEMAAAPGSTINGLGLWDGSRWTPLGKGQGVRGFQDLCGLAGSVFLESSGIAGPDNVRGTAVWRDSAWHAFAIPTDTDLSFDTAPKLMAERDGRLVALGRLRDGPKTSACEVNPFPWHIAELGARWKVLSPPLPRDKVDCKAVLLLGSQVFVIGDFGSEGNFTEGAMIWDGKKWRAGRLNLDGGSIVKAAVVRDRIVVAIGQYTFKRGEKSTFTIVEGDGETWRTIRDSTSSQITALGTWEEKLVAAFAQPFPDVTEPSNLQVWDGQSWSPLPGEFSSMFAGSGRVQALTVHQWHLVAAGDFRGVDGRVAANIAFLADGVWHPMRVGVDVWVSHLVSSADGLWLGGSFRHAGGELSLGVARWEGDLPIDVPLDSIPPYVPEPPLTSKPVTAISTAEDPTNPKPSLVTNGDLRTWGADNLPVGWVWDSWCPRESGIKSPPPEAAPGGSGVRLHSGGIENCWASLSQSIAITGGRCYRVRARFDPVVDAASHGNSSWMLGFTDYSRGHDGQAGMSLHTGMEVPVPNAGGWVEIALRADPTAAFGGVAIRAREPAPDLTLREVTCDTISMTDAEVLQSVCAELRRRLVVQSQRAVNWDSLQASAIVSLGRPTVTAKTALLELLRGVGEPRITVEEGESDVRWRTGFRDQNPPPATDGLPSGPGNTISAQLSDWQRNGLHLSTGWTHDNIAYVQVTDPIVSADWLTDLTEADGLLVDLRGSSAHYDMGERPMEGYRPIAAWLIDAPGVWGYARDAAPHAVAEDTLRIEPATGARALMPVVCLIDGSCRDLSAECALMLKGAGRVTLVGRPTGGGTGGVEELVVGTGCQVGFPAHSLWDPEGRLINDNHGVEPDVFVAPDGSLDPVYQEGLRVLREKIASAHH